MMVSDPGMQPGWNQRSRSDRRMQVSDVAGSKRKAFRHGTRFVGISELQEEEIATSRVFRTPISLGEHQTSFITRVLQNAFGLTSEGIQPPTRRQ